MKTTKETQAFAASKGWLVLGSAHTTDKKQIIHYTGVTVVAGRSN